MTVFTKDPDAVLDYTVDWSQWLASGDLLAASVWVVQEGITIASPSPTFSDTSATIWLSGGSLWKTYRVTNRITTVDGRVQDYSIAIKIAQQ